MYKRQDDYLSALEKELDYTAVKFAHKKLNSIYIGGGTPTTLNPQQLDRLIRKIKCSFDLSHLVEFTVAVSYTHLDVYKRQGVEPAERAVFKRYTATGV